MACEMTSIVGLAVAVLIGFLAGLLAFKVKSRWCTGCGTVKSCPKCAGWAGSAVADGVSSRQRVAGSLSPSVGRRMSEARSI